MSQVSVFQCDGPSCLESIEDAYDEDDLIAAGWLIVSFTVDDEDDRTAHLHSHACLVAWAAEGAAVEEAE